MKQIIEFDDDGWARGRATVEDDYECQSHETEVEFPTFERYAANTHFRHVDGKWIQDEIDPDEKFRMMVEREPLATRILRREVDAFREENTELLIKLTEQETLTSELFYKIGQMTGRIKNLEQKLEEIYDALLQG